MHKYIREYDAGFNTRKYSFCIFRSKAAPQCTTLFSAGMFGAVKPGFRSLATLKLVANVVGEL